MFIENLRRGEIPYSEYNNHHTMKGFLAKAKTLFLNVLFPSVCLNCRRHLDDERNRFDVVCGVCFENIKVRDAFCCPVCAGRLPSGEKTCHPKSAYLLAAAASYDDEAVQKLVWRLKYRLCPPPLFPGRSPHPPSGNGGGSLKIPSSFPCLSRRGGKKRGVLIRPNCWPHPWQAASTFRSPATSWREPEIRGRRPI